MHGASVRITAQTDPLRIVHRDKRCLTLTARASLRVLTLCLVLVTSLLVRSARAAEPSARECLAASESWVALRSQQRLRAAKVELVMCAQAACPSDIRNECARHTDELAAAVPTILFHAQDRSGNDLDEVRVLMDGELLSERLDGMPHPVDPGRHLFRFESVEHPAIEKSLFVREGQKDRREAIVFGLPPPRTILEAAPPSAPNPEPPARSSGATALAISSAVLGVTGLGLGTAFAVKSVARHRSAAAACPNECPDQHGVELWNEARAAGNVATVGFVVGALGVAGAGVIWFASRPSSGSASTPQVGIALGSVVLRGTW